MNPQAVGEFSPSTPPRSTPFGPGALLLGVRNHCAVAQEPSGLGPEEVKLLMISRREPRRAHLLHSRVFVAFHGKQNGFSLLELMIVVVIIGILTALALPGMSQASRERRIQQAAVSVLDVAREVRTRAMYRCRAQTLLISVSGTALRLDAYEGSSPSCRLSNFGPGALDTNQRVANLDLTEPRFARDNLGATIALPTATTFLQICYTPLGAAFFSTTQIVTASQAWGNDTGLLGIGGVFQLNVFQTTGGATRRILIPLGGMPRMRT